jgi:predicted GTPase
MGYGRSMVAELERTVNAVPADVVVAGTPIDLGRVLRPNKPVVRARYEFRDAGRPTLADILRERFGRAGSGP